MEITQEQLKYLTYEDKIMIAKQRIREWYGHWGGKVYVAFSGGKDSTALLHLVRSIYPDVEGVFCDTGLEYPEIRDFVKETPNIVWVKPKMDFKSVIEKYGYPVISKEISKYIHEYKVTKSSYLKDKRMNGKKGSVYKIGKIPNCHQFLINAPFKISDHCCKIMKKNPSKEYEKKTGNYVILGTTIDESQLRLQSWKKHGCNAFDLKRPQSRPISLWSKSDIWRYIKENKLSYSSIYNKGYQRTGCMFCMFGLSRDNLDGMGMNRFSLMKKTHPKQYQYCMEKLGLGKILQYIYGKGNPLF